MMTEKDKKNEKRWEQFASFLGALTDILCIFVSVFILHRFIQDMRKATLPFFVEVSLDAAIAVLVFIFISLYFYLKYTINKKNKKDK